MIDITQLTPWGGEKPAEGDEKVSDKGVRFPFKPEYNKRVSLETEAKALNLKCDVIVVPTNATLDSEDCLHERIVSMLGPDFHKQTKALVPLKIQEPRVLPVPEEKIGAKNVMVMLPPRFSKKYLSAAINSLHKTYLNALQAAIDNGYRTIVFTAIHDLENKYDANIAAEVVVRTIRRFLEHYPNNVDMICMCLGEHATEEYTKQMKLYFPRSAEEAVNAEKALPKDVGNEWGEMVVEGRSIRISSLPGMGGDDDSDYSDDEDDQIPEVVGEKHETLEFSQKQPSPDTINTQGMNDPSSPNYIPPGYVTGILERAKSLDLKPMEQANFFYKTCVDSLSKREVLVFIGKNFMQPTVDRGKLMPFMATILDSVSFSQFTIVYVHCPETNNSESMAWIHSIAATFPRRCLCNMRLAVLYPTFWLKTHLRLNRLGGLRPVQDISYYDNLAALFRVVGKDAVRLPDEILRADTSVQFSASSSAASSSSQPPEDEGL